MSDPLLMLAYDPIGCSLLGIPRLQKLFGNGLQLSRISCSIDGAIDPLHFEGLTHGDAD